MTLVTASRHRRVKSHCIRGDDRVEWIGIRLLWTHRPASCGLSPGIFQRQEIAVRRGPRRRVRAVARGQGRRVT